VSAGSPPGGTRDAARRWREAVAAEPLETPRPLPSGLHHLLGTEAALPRYTTGPKTRRALEAAGALGATTGSVVHLPETPAPGGPAAMFGVLAHELAHARQPLPRTRFLLHTPDPAADAEERAAQHAGRSAETVLARRTTGIGTPAGQHRHAETHTAGLVARLPVGGAATVAAAPTSSADAPAVQRLAGRRSAGPVTTRPEPVEAPAPQQTDDPDDLDEADETGAADPVAQPAAGPTTGGATPGVGGTSVHSAPATTGGPAAGPATPQGPDIEALLQAIEQRLLRQIERRGGRYAGLF
jgi:hypothetical protein